MKDIHGRPVTLDKKADALAEYLEKVHWALIIDQPEEQIDKTLIFRHPPPVEAGSITVEVQQIVNSLKTNKAPGPDGTVTELYKHLDENSIKNLAQILDQMWAEEKILTDFTQAEVVSIYKKGTAELPQNYRPISLLNTSSNQNLPNKTFQCNW